MLGRDTLLQRILAANLLLFVAVLFAATALSSVDIPEQRRDYLVIAMSMILVLLLNFLLTRRRFDPLERLIARVEALDPADPAGFQAPAGGPEEIERLATAFRRVLAGIEEERNRSGRLVLRAQEAERRRIARDLHDESNQALAAVTLRLEALAQDAPAALAQELLETKRLASQAMKELLALARQLRPAALDDHGLIPALSSQVKRFRELTGIDARLVTEGDPSGLAGDHELVVYRIAQEALTNAGRHSGAERVEVSLREREGEVELSVSDDGSGFRRSPHDAGLGLDGMAERARLIGAGFEIESAPRRGTRVRLRVPA